MGIAAKVIIEKSRCEVSPNEQDTIENLFLAYNIFERNIFLEFFRKNFNFILCNFLVRTLQRF